MAFKPKSIHMLKTILVLFVLVLNALSIVSWLFASNQPLSLRMALALYAAANGAVAFAYLQYMWATRDAA